MIFLLSEDTEPVLRLFLSINNVLVELMKAAAGLSSFIWCESALFELFFYLRISM